LLGLPLAIAGCVGPVVPPDAFTLDEEMLGQRQMQSRRFDGVSERSLLIASADLLQDMGFNLENSETALGVVTASKDRDASNVGEMFGAILVAAMFGVSVPVSIAQRIRVSIVIQPAGGQSVIAPSPTFESTTEATPSEAEVLETTNMTLSSNDHGDYVIRATFQRIVTLSNNSVRVETINENEIYDEFFDKLSKSMFIEAQQV